MRLFRVAVVVTGLAAFGMVGCGGGDVVDQPQPTKSAEEEMQEMQEMEEKMRSMAPGGANEVPSTPAPGDAPSE